MRVSVIIPTYQAEPYLADLLERLLEQTVEAEILVIDSTSRDDTARIARRYAKRVRFLQIPKAQFDHGGTRDNALRQTQGEYICFLTQDALPVDERYLERLLETFSEPDIGAVSGRQIARPDAPAYERLTREFNYPDTHRIWREQDIARYGVKAYFFSNACSAYRRDAYEAVGGFDAPIATNEDMLIAAKLLHAGFALAYEPRAAVFHSHNHTLIEEFRRNELIGQVMQTYRERLVYASANVEGRRLVRFVSMQLLHDCKITQLGAFGMHVAARLLGHEMGKRKARQATAKKDSSPLSPYG